MHGPAANAGTISSTGAAHEYAGIGPGRARPARHRRRPPRHRDGKTPGKLARAGRARGHGLVTDDVLTREETADEFLLMGLRLAEGIDTERYAAVAGRPLDPDRIAALREHDLIETTAAGRLRVSMAGFPRA